MNTIIPMNKISAKITQRMINAVVDAILFAEKNSSLSNLVYEQQFDGFDER